MQGHIHKALFCAVFVLYLIPDAEVESKIIRYFPQRLRLNDTHEDHAAALPARKCPYHCKLNITDTKWCPLHCRPYKRMSAGVSSTRIKRQAPQLIFNCTPRWDISTHKYDIDLQYTLTGAMNNWIDLFNIKWRKNRTGSFYYPEEVFFTYSQSFTKSHTDAARIPFKLYDNNQLTIHYRLVLHFSSSYPGADSSIVKTCTLDITPPPPTRITNLSVSLTNIQDFTAITQTAVVKNITLHWKAPASPNTDSSNLHYQLGVVGNTDVHNLQLLSNGSDAVNISVFIESLILHKILNANNIQIMIRSYYNVTVETANALQVLEMDRAYSEWSDPVLLIPPPEVSTTPPPPLQVTTTPPSIASSLLELKATSSIAHSELPVFTSSPTPTSKSLPPSPTRKVSPLPVGAIAGGISGVGAVVLILFAFTVCFIVWSRRRKVLMTVFNDSNADWLLPVFSRNVSVDSTSSALHLDKWEIPLCYVEMNDKLGAGEFGQVFKGMLLTELYHGQVVAIKRLKSHATGTEKSDFLKEIDLMKQIAEGNNSHVVNMVGCVTIQEPLCLITEFVEHGDLHSYLSVLRKNKLLLSSDHHDTTVMMETGLLDENNNLSVNVFVSFSYQISSGMEYLSSLGVIHRDLACRNILVGSGNVLKITDFGMSRMASNDGAYVKTTSGRLPLKWMAIESIIHREFTSASDVWSFGVTLWEIITLGGFPYPTIDNDDFLPLLRQGLRLDKPESCPIEVFEIMMQCWAENPSERPTFIQLRGKFDQMLANHETAPQYVQLVDRDGSNASCLESNCSDRLPPSPQPSMVQLTPSLGSFHEGSTNPFLSSSTNPYVRSPKHAANHDELKCPSYLALPLGSHVRSPNSFPSPSPQMTPDAIAIRFSELIQAQSINNNATAFDL